MRPPSPATYSTPSGPPSHITILLTSTHILYAHVALQRSFLRYPAAPLIVSLTGGGPLHLYHHETYMLDTLVPHYPVLCG